MNTYQVRNISPGGTVWAVPQPVSMQTVAYPSSWGVTNSGPLTTIMPVVQGFSPNEAMQVFGPTIYPVGGRSAVVAAPAATSIIPGYVEGGPVWGRTMVPASTITQIQNAQMETALQREAARTQAIAENEARKRAEEAEMRLIQTRNQTFASLGIKPRKNPDERFTAQEQFIMKAFDELPGTLEEKVNNAVAARNKINYFQSIGVGVGKKSDLDGRLVKPEDDEWSIWKAYDQGGPMAAEQARQTILTRGRTQRNNTSSSVLRNAKKVNNQERSEAARKAEERGAGGRARNSTYRSRSPSSATRGAGGRARNSIYRSRSPSSATRGAGGRASSAERRTNLKSLGPVKQNVQVQVKPEFTRRLSPRTVARFPEDKRRRYIKFEKNLEKEEENLRKEEEEEILKRFG